MRKLAACLLLLAPCSAAASTFDTFGFGARGIAMGGAMTADARDFTATFYNPSLLVLRTDVNLGLGFFYEAPNTKVTPDAPNAAFAPLSPPGSSSYTVGFVFPFAGKLQDRAALGVGISLPTRNLIKVQAVEPNIPSWYLYQSSPDSIQLFGGLGIRPLDWLSVGVGMQALSDFGGDINFNVDLFNKSFQQRSITNELVTKVGMVAGITFMPLHNLRLAFNWRQSLQLNYELPTHIALGDVGTLYLDVKGVAFYTPHEFTFGVRYDPVPSVTLTGDLEYARWSVAPNPAAQVQVRFSGDLAHGLGLDQALALDSHDAALGYEDILIPRFGVEWHIVDMFALRAGYYFRPTMIPEQNGLTNLLDGPTHVLSAGLGFWFMSPFETLTEPVEIAAVYQHGFIGERHAEKNAANPVPSYTYSAQTDLLSVELRFNFDIVRPTPSKPAPARNDDVRSAPADKPRPEQPKGHKLKDHEDDPFAS